MEFNKEYITTYYKSIKAEKNYPEAFLYELFLVGKISRDKEIIAEISEILQEYGTSEINSAFKTRNKLPENGKGSEKVINTLLHFGTKDPLLPIGKLYNMMGFSLVFMDNTAIVQKLEKQPDLISRLNGINELRIKEVFSGEIPDEICDIKSLEVLEIEGSYKKLPEAIGNLQKLEIVNLDLPELAYFPDSFWTLEAIKELDLENISTGFQASLHLDKLSNLVELTFLKVNLTDASQLELPLSLEKLSFIRLENISKLPNSFTSLKNLQRIQIYKCPNLKEIPDGLENLKNLSSIDFREIPSIKGIKDKQLFTESCNSFSLDKNIPILNTGTSFLNSELLISDVKILEYVLANPKNFPNLKSLKIYYNPDFTNLSLGLGELPTLESVAIHMVSNTETLFSNIDKCTQLKSLSISNANMESFPEGLKKLPYLEYLSFNSCPKLILQGDNLPKKIKELELFVIKEFIPGKHYLETDSASFAHLILENPKNLFKTLITKKLKFSEINKNKNTQEELTQYLPKPEALNTLKVHTNTANYKDVLLHCTQLEHLDLNNEEESTAVLTTQPAPQLKYLKLSSYKANNLGDILKNTPNLETLDIRHYEASIIFLRVPLPYLKVLDLSYTRFKTLEALHAPALHDLRIALSYEFGMEGYSKLNRFKSLKKLSFVGISREVNTIPESITELELTEFLIGHNFEVLPEYIKKMTSLETLSLGGNEFIDLPTWIADLPKLDRLDIDGCRFENDVPEYFQKLKLKELKYYISKFGGFNMNPNKYKYLITPGYTQLKKEFTKDI
ncbi:hypothetical protein [uncultured Salegentibacter sp.]|uniref:hypothetical protein n=1 Tax=uncultured Salegentibacter sp. TaxID=259320 RepID=UPI00259598F9|nr:hypothetical protein [uncultured Salegentibacter sp.]